MEKRNEMTKLFDEIFCIEEHHSLALMYLGSLMEESECAEELDSKRRQVVLLREYLETTEVPRREYYLQKVREIEAILDLDSRVVYHSMTFCEQMSWISEEVENLILLDRANEESSGTIRRLFALIRSDPKNRDLIPEIHKAEADWNAFISGNQDAATAKEMLAFWHGYVQKYENELKQKEC